MSNGVHTVSVSHALRPNAAYDLSLDLMQSKAHCKDAAWHSELSLRWTAARGHQSVDVQVVICHWLWLEIKPMACLRLDSIPKRRQRREQGS